LVAGFNLAPPDVVGIAEGHRGDEFVDALVHYFPALDVA
jgi:hypothetical protein